MNLFEAMLETVRLIDSVFEGTATGGSTTTLIDTNQFPTIDDYFNQGTMFLISGPRTESFVVVSDYVNNTRTWTIPAGTAITTSQRYAAAGPRYPYHRLRQAINTALIEIGPLTQVDETLTVTDDTEEYELPDGVVDVVLVEVATAAAAPYGWKPLYYWRESNGYLVFDKGKAPGTADMLLRLHYNAPHAEVVLAADEILPAVAGPRLVWTAAVAAVQQRLRLTQNDEPKLEKWLKDVGLLRAEEMRRRYPVRNLPPTPHPTGWLS